MKLLFGITLLLTAAVFGLGQGKRGENTRGSGDVEHGKYIVQNVAQCIQCHTPRDAKGALLMSRLMTGAPIPFRSPFPDEEWAFEAPRISGMPGYSEEDGVRLLTQGIARSGQRPRPPMPRFGMTEQDARDVVAYLKSIE